jgi:hypothetical protein
MSVLFRETVRQSEEGESTRRSKGRGIELLGVPQSTRLKSIPDQTTVILANSVLQGRSGQRLRNRFQADRMLSAADM